MKTPGKTKLYSIEYLPEVVTVDIPALPKTVKTMIKNAIEMRLTSDPIRLGKPLRYSLKGHRRLRVSDYRIIYRIDTLKNSVVIIAIKHRRYVYEDA